MRVFELFQTRQIDGFEGLTIDASSLYLIAAPSTPAEVREVVDRARGALDYALSG
ncbi:MAG TPA: hypothetical protein VGP42_07240 [Stellaceae bacterium]|nr:hypothetical protein [Stellaceae bacterium]